MTQYDLLLMTLFGIFSTGLGLWLGYLVFGSIVFWWKYEKGSFDVDCAPAGNWPKIAIVAVIDDKAEKPWLSLQSALAQNYGNKEILVVANAVSKDMLDETLEKLNGECFRIIELSTKASLSTVFNMAVNLTDAETIFIADPGVHMSSDTVTKLSMQMYQDSRVGVVFARKKIVFGGVYTPFEYFSASVRNLSQMASRIYGKLGITDEQCALFRKTALKDIGFFSKTAPHIIANAGWKLQLRYWSARFESKAEYWTTPVSSLREYFKLTASPEVILNYNRAKFGKMLKNKKQMRFWPNYFATYFKKFFGLVTFALAVLLIHADLQGIATSTYRELLSVYFIVATLVLGLLGTALSRNKKWVYSVVWLPASLLHFLSKTVVSALLWKKR